MLTFLCFFYHTRNTLVQLSAVCFINCWLSMPGAENNLVKDLTVVTHIFYLSNKKVMIFIGESHSTPSGLMPSISCNPLIASGATHIKALWAFILHVN